MRKDSRINSRELKEAENRIAQYQEQQAQSDVRAVQPGEETLSRDKEVAEKWEPIMQELRERPALHQKKPEKTVRQKLKGTGAGHEL